VHASGGSPIPSLNISALGVKSSWVRSVKKAASQAVPKPARREVLGAALEQEGVVPTLEVEEKVNGVPSSEVKQPQSIHEHPSDYRWVSQLCV